MTRKTYKRIIISLPIWFILVFAISFYVTRMHENNDIKTETVKTVTVKAVSSDNNSNAYWYNLSDREVFDIFDEKCRSTGLEYSDVFDYRDELKNPNTSELVIEAAKLCKKIEERWLELVRSRKQQDRDEKAKELLEEYGDN